MCKDIKVNSSFNNLLASNFYIIKNFKIILLINQWFHLFHLPNLEIKISLNFSITQMIQWWFQLEMHAGILYKRTKMKSLEANHLLEITQKSNQLKSALPINSWNYNKIKMNSKLITSKSFNKYKMASQLYLL